MKIVIIGAGSPYSPEIVKELASRRDTLRVQEIALHDIDAQRLEVISAFLARYARALDMAHVRFSAHTDWNRALAGADFVITQYRVGGSKARVQDERIPLRHGFIGQETTGPGGMMKALRTIPVALSLAGAMQAHCPRAVMINYTNPSGMIAEALSKYTAIRSVGLCAGGIRPAQETARVTGCPEEAVRYDYFGLNHLSFAYNITVGGEPLSEHALHAVLEGRHGEATPEWIRACGLFPSSYVQYYFRTGHNLDKMRAAPETRGEQTQALEKIIYDAYADPSRDQPPPELQLRGGGGYSQVAVGVLQAIHNNEDRWMVCNVPNRGTVSCLPGDAVIETGCLVNAAGIFPLPQPHFPKQVWGLVCAVKNYEQLTVEAAVTGERDTALAALAAHPLVRDVDRAVPLLQELLEANRAYLPQFFNND